MKKLLSITIGCLLLMAGLTFGQTASFSFNDNNGTANAGSYNPNDTLTLSFFGTATGFTADGFSLWLEAPTASGFSSALSITGRTYFQFSDGTQNVYPKLFTDTAGAQAGYLSDKQGTLSGDLGATANVPTEDFTGGPALLANYNFSLSGAAPGTYVMFTTTLSPKGSGMNSDTFAFFNAPAASYTFTIVPEPSTWSLIALGGLGAIGMIVLRRRQSRA